jgi:hypothetical protein
MEIKLQTFLFLCGATEGTLLGKAHNEIQSPSITCIVVWTYAQKRLEVAKMHFLRDVEG